MGVRAWLTLGALLGTTALAGQEPRPSPAPIATHLAAHLPLLGLTLEDVRFKRDVVEAEGRLPVADIGLQDPLKHIGWMRRTETSWGGLSPAALAHEAARLLGVDDVVELHTGSPLPVFDPEGRAPIQKVVEAVPGPLREPLGCVLVAMMHVRQVQNEIDWSPELWQGLRWHVEEDLQEAAGAAEAFRRGPASEDVRVLAAHLEVARAVERFVEAARKVRTTTLPETRVLVETPVGWVMIAGPGDDRHQRECALIVDFGGDDIYLGGCAAGTPELPVSLVIDVAGDDTYRSETSAQGSGRFGCGILWDLAGDDVYDSRGMSQGSAILGLGMLVDDGTGRDVYRVTDTGQGHAVYGVGLLLDGGGNDLYRGGELCQATARTRGVGLLRDTAGHDHYHAGDLKLHRPLFDDQFRALSQGTAIGYRYQKLAGGVAVLHDLAGNDTYTSDIYGQGSGYWFGCGMLWDRSGNDRYQCVQYGIAAGIHLASGYILERSGDDTYLLRNGIGVGGAHDFAVGGLIDESGGDHYHAGSTAMGGAINNAFALLADLGGDDHYMIAGPGGRVARARPSRHMPSLGIQLDVGGRDNYRAGGADGEVRASRGMSLSLDLPGADEADE